MRGSRTRSVVVRFTANFEANLASIEAFLTQGESAQGVDHLLDELGEVVLPNIERFPAIGRPFLVHVPQSAEALAIADRLRAALARIAEDSELREYVMHDYVILYALISDCAYMLSIRHQRQLSFDFGKFWFSED